MRLIALASFFLFFCSGAIRQVCEDVTGATSQRLMSFSLDHAMSEIPEEAFAAFRGKPRLIRCHYLVPDGLPDYATRRLAMELRQRFNMTLTHASAEAEFVQDFFFNGLGTDSDSFGLESPGLVIPGFGAAPTISLINLDLYHGVTEMHYYISDVRNPAEIVRGERIIHITKSDRLSTPRIAFPIGRIKNSGFCSSSSAG